MHFTGSLFSTSLQYYKKGKEICIERLVSFFICILVVTTIICVFIMSSPSRKFNINETPESKPEKENVPFQLNDQETQCELFNGQWIPYDNGSYYTSTNCIWIPDWKNCFKHGRENMGFLNWRWKPERCQLPRFDPDMFLQIVQDKRMLFLGDSVARNQMESLLCLLSQVADPTEVTYDADDDCQELQIKSHNFTIYFLRSTFLVQHEEIMENNISTGSFNLHIDKVDKRWARILPAMDYAIISDAHWFFRRNYLYEDGKLIGCVHCSDLNVTKLGLAFAVGKASRAALKFINACKDCKDRLVTFLRTFSPAHFEGGAWDSSGYCNKTRPSEEEINLGGVDWEIRTAQVEEIERARKEGEKSGRKFEVLDVTKAMLMRPDGHPNSNWGNQWNKGINDCLHWCLPGPIDLWSEFLLALLKNGVGLPL